MKKDKDYGLVSGKDELALLKRVDKHIKHDKQHEEHGYKLMDNCKIRIKKDK